MKDKEVLQKAIEIAIENGLISCFIIIIYIVFLLILINICKDDGVNGFKKTNLKSSDFKLFYKIQDNSISNAKIGDNQITGI